MKQGFSGSKVSRKGEIVVKKTSDVGFVKDSARHAILQRLSKKLLILPTIFDINGANLTMEHISGEEGLSADNAEVAGISLKCLHSQTDYPFPVFTGVRWLLEKANQALFHHDIKQEVLPDLHTEASDIALIHTEPVQLISRADGTVVFIDIEGIGEGSRYQDLGFLYYYAAITGNPALFERVLSGYGSEGVDMKKVSQFAGVISIAYSTFADSDNRIALGLQLLRDAQ